MMIAGTKMTDQDKVERERSEARAEARIEAWRLNVLVVHEVRKVIAGPGSDVEKLAWLGKQLN
jgi:hypothetical protein